MEWRGRTRGCSRCRRSDRGQALPLVALQLWVILGVALIAAMVGGRAVDRARAQAGADAVALAVAGGGSGAELAQLNGVVVVQLHRGDETDVVVSTNGVEAAARAQRVDPARVGLNAELLDAITRAERLLGTEIRIISGRRSRDDQQRLWANRHHSRYPVARPGESLHEAGLAVDVDLSVASRMAALSSETGLCRPLPELDPVHFVLC